jgi:hypothetical protein
LVDTSRRLKNNSEQTLFVEPSCIGTERLGGANQGDLICNTIGERAETPIGIDIVNNDCALLSQDRPGLLKLEADIALAVQAVMDEKVDLTELIKQSRKTAPARSLDVRPSIRMAGANGSADLLVPGPFQRRKIDAPKMAVTVPLQRLKNES